MTERRLHHVSVRVRDVARAREFYEDCLGVPAAPRPDLGIPGLWYSAGASQIHLIGGDKMAPDGIDPTDPHFALEVDDLAGIRGTLDARGISYLALGDALLWVRDPDGNTVELRGPDAPIR